jgi:hypothetical protein
MNPNLEQFTLSAQQYFPNLKIKYKDESLFMKILGSLLFFNKSFMATYTTTIGSTIYFPSKKFVEERYYSSILILLHELVHVQDGIKFNPIIFAMLYLSPQIFGLLSVPLFFISWKIALITLIVSILPLPSFFRMYFEKRAYFVSLYAMYAMIKNHKIDASLEENKKFYLSQFKNASYYFMWTFKNLDKEFSDAVLKIKSGEKPYSDPIFNIIDDLLNKV